MIRVGFVVGHTDLSWVGGLNYLRTLIAAVQAQPQPLIKVVLLLSPSVPQSIRDSFPDTEQIVSPWLESSRLRRVLRQASRFLLGVDRPLEQILKCCNIDVLSHSWHFDRSADVRTIEWIPDLQHRHLPEYFSPVEVASRERIYRRTAERCTALVVSSQAALNDLQELYEPALLKSHVLHFVAHPSTTRGRTPLIALASRYGINGNYFHLPNQFWIHKNHRVVIDALATMKSIGQLVTVFCTGHTVDARHPTYFEEIMAYAKAKDVEDQFQVLGLVPVPDLYGLMEHAVAVINPSHFEGWSTTVEEAKALGKCVVLSDISVHREQAPIRGFYFPADDSNALALKMQHVLADFSPERECEAQMQAEETHRQRFLELGRNYQSIVEMVHGQH